MFKKIIHLSILFCLFSIPAWAGIQPGAFTLSPMYGSHTFEGNLSLDSSDFWGIGLGYNLTENWALEAVYTKTDADAEDTTTTDTDVETYRLDALYHFWPSNKLVPYLAAGLGGISSDPDVGSSSNHLLFNYGAGIKYFILDDLIALRAEIRHLLDFPEPDNSLQYSAGLTFQFGKPTPAPVPVIIPEPEPLDSDNDGVTDDLDQCPNTPAGETVNSVGCPLDSDKDGVTDNLDQCPNTPAGTSVDSKGCPLDSDKDGVTDNLDQCPNTPAGASVDSKGCPLDSDGDGVFDYLDQCPNTPKEVAVDANGCSTKLTLHINFGQDSSKIGMGYDNEIAKAARFINDYPDNVVFIDGHTDNTGSTKYNQKLSEQRAAIVKNRLIDKFNIPGSRITSRGFGENKPVASNKTSEGRALNRRVEVVCGAK